MRKYTTEEYNAIEARNANPRRQYQNAVNRATGREFEALIDRSLSDYARRRIASIDKTPEPMQPTKDLGGGRFVAHYAKKAQVDYKGCIRGGRMIAFDAKHTFTDRMERTRVTDGQADYLDDYAELGAACFVVVGFDMRRFFRVPWEAWKRMKEIFGHAYATPDDLATYEIPIIRGGYLGLLEPDIVIAGKEFSTNE